MSYVLTTCSTAGTKDAWYVRTRRWLRDELPLLSRQSKIEIVVEGGGDLVDYPMSVLLYRNISSMRFSYVVTGLPEQHRQIEEIINKHLQGDRDLLLCQDELIDAGLERWARL